MPSPTAPRSFNEEVADLMRRREARIQAIGSRPVEARPVSHWGKALGATAVVAALAMGAHLMHAAAPVVAAAHAAATVATAPVATSPSVDPAAPQVPHAAAPTAQASTASTVRPESRFASAPWDAALARQGTSWPGATAPARSHWLERVAAPAPLHGYEALAGLPPLPHATATPPGVRPPIEAVESTQSLAKKFMQGNEPFMALAVTMEALRIKPYWDKAGLNLGMGYCVPERIKEFGIDRVAADFKHIGLTDEQSQVFLHGTRAQQSHIELSTAQAVALLELTEPDYRDIARAFAGPAFEQMAPRQQAVLTWLAYNTGEDHIQQFRHLRHALDEGQWTQAAEHMTPYFTDTSGKVVPNTRAGEALKAAFLSDQGLWATVAPGVKPPLPTTQVQTSSTALATTFAPVAQGLQHKRAARAARQAAPVPEAPVRPAPMKP